MSVQAISWALSIKGITPPEKLILLAVANYADADGLCWPSQATLARDTCLSTRTIVRLFSALEKRGFMSRERRPRRLDGTRTSAFIRLNLHSDRVSLGRVQPSDTVSSDIVTACHLHSDTVSPKPSLNHQEEPSARERAQELENEALKEEVMAWAKRFTGRKMR